MSDKTAFGRIMSKADGETPKYSYADLLELRNSESKQLSDEIAQRRKDSSSKAIVGRSGILPIHQHCSIDNYIVNCQGQQYALEYAKWFLDNFHSNNGSSFIFGGTTGTGKNHLSAAMCNALMAQGNRCLVITVSELMMRLNSCYSEGARVTEEQFFDGMTKLDLLVIDEIGLGRTSVNASNNERLAINQIIDKRLCHLRPTGILTNLDQQGINDHLGVRIMDRMKNDNGQWVEFNWPSFRS